MSLRSIALTLAGLAATAAIAQSPLDTPASAPTQSESPIGYPTVAAALEALRARSDANVSVQGGWTIVNVGSERSIWSFTPPEHPAHPAAIKRTLVLRDGAAFIDMRALCQADKAACDKLIEEFNQLNARIRESMQRQAASNGGGTQQAPRQ